MDEGRIRHIGVSNYDAAQVAEFAETRPVEALQPPYDLFRRDIEAEILPYAADHDVGVLAYGPLAHGLLTGAMDEGDDARVTDAGESLDAGLKQGANA